MKKSAAGSRKAERWCSDIAHLIDRKYVERYQNKFATTSAMMRECLMQLSGPWPPYHFVHKLTRSAHAQTHVHAVPQSVPCPSIPVLRAGTCLA
jgi:hypothetical protein